MQISGSEKNRKRDVTQYYRSNERTDNRNNLPGRGDIPIIHGDCDGKKLSQVSFVENLFQVSFSAENLLRGINDLIALVKKLQQDIANQHADIKRLQSLIENCAGCQEPQSLRHQPDTCQYVNPCYPGKWL